MSWKDGCRGESSEFRTKRLRITVHTHIDYPGAWLVSAYHDLRIERVELAAKDLQSAKVEGLAVIREMLEAMLKDLPVSR